MERRDETTSRGVLSGGAAVLRELLRTPRNRRSLDVLIAGLDAEGGRRLARVLLDEPALALDLISSAPVLANALIAGAHEALDQTRAYPPRLVNELGERLLAEVSAEKLGAVVGLSLLMSSRLCGGEQSRLIEGFLRGIEAEIECAEPKDHETAGRLASSALGRLESLLGRLGTESLRKGSAVERAVAATRESIERLGREHPELWSGIVLPLIEASREAARGAGESQGGRR